MKFLTSLKNIELYRKLRLFRNLKKATAITFEENDNFNVRANKILEVVVLAPEIEAIIIDSDYSCRANPTPSDENPWNVFFHLKLKIINHGKESSQLVRAYLKVGGHSEKLDPKVYDNEGGAFNYIKGGKYESPVPSSSEQVLPLNFIMPTQKEKTKGLKISLALYFENCRRQVISKIVSRP